MDVISFSAAAKVGKVAKNALNTVGKVGTKDVDETNIADKKVLAYNTTTGKLEYITVTTGSGGGEGGSTVTDSPINGRILVDGVEVVVYDDSTLTTNSHTHTNKAALDKLGVSATNTVTVNGVDPYEVKQVTKLSVTAPHLTKVAIDSSLDFKFRPLEVLKLQGDPTLIGDNKIKTLNVFDNSDVSDFTASTDVIFDGVMKLKKVFPLTPTVLQGDVYITPMVTKATYKNFEGLNVPVGNKYVVRDVSGNYKSYQLVRTSLAYTFSTGEMNKFENPGDFVFASNNLTLKNPTETKTMVQDTNYVDTGTLFRTSLTKTIQSVELMN